MFDYLNKPEMEKGKENSGDFSGEIILSFRKKRIARRLGRREQQRKKSLEKLLSLKNINRHGSSGQHSSPGPTAETRAKLTPDPLVLFKRQNILNDGQIWAFQCIRRAIDIITEGSRLRVSGFNNVMVDYRHPSRLSQNEPEYEIRLKSHYTDWIDHMTLAHQQAGPILDIIIDEMSLGAVDRKWGKRKGWAKGELQSALNRYQSRFSSTNRKI